MGRTAGLTLASDVLTIWGGRDPLGSFHLDRGPRRMSLLLLYRNAPRRLAVDPHALVGVPATVRALLAVQTEKVIAVAQTVRKLRVP